MESFVDTPEGRGTVVEVDLLRQRVKVRMEDSPETISVFANADIAVLRSGKAKKNDPPIPADLAPISGSGKRVRKTETEDEPIRLDPIRFRYSTEAVVDEPEEPAEESVSETPDQKEHKSRSRRRKPRQDAPQTDEAPKAEAPRTEAPKKEKKDAPRKDHSKKDAPKAEPQQKKEPAPKAPKEPAAAPAEAPDAETGDTASEAAKKKRRHNYRRYRKPKTPSEG